MEKFVEGNAIQTLDSNLEANDAINLAVEKMYELALQCLAPTKRNRPSMRRCAEILWSIRKDYRELVVPTSAMNWSSSPGAIKRTKDAFQFASLQRFWWWESRKRFAASSCERDWWASLDVVCLLLVTRQPEKNLFLQVLLYSMKMLLSKHVWIRVYSGVCIL